MSVPARAPAIRSTAAATRVVGATLALALAGTGCGYATTIDPDTPPATPPGQPAGTLVVPAGADVAATVQRVRDAITAAGGTVVTVIEHAADASGAGTEIPPSTTVIGGPPAASLPLLRVDQRAAANLPQRYLVRRATDGAVTITTNGADYVAAVSGVVPPDARALLHDATRGVLEAAAPGSATVRPAPLLGVTPAGRIIERSADGAVAAAVERLRTAAEQPPTSTVAVVDMAEGATDGGPPLRPTTLVLVSHPEVAAPLLAAAPSIGIELPLPFLVWLDERGDARLGHPDVRQLAARHGIPGDDPAVGRLAVEAERLAVAGATAVTGQGR